MRAATGVLGAVLALLAGCAPSTLSPMAVRLVPGNPGQVTARAGVRTGPRLSVPLQDPEHFQGNRAPFSTPQWAVAYDGDMLVPLGGGTGLHVGLQGEVGCDEVEATCPVPVPGYGLSLGLSQYLQLGDVSLAPAVVLRGATDFGFGAKGGPSSILGVEASASLALRMEGTVVGVVPFLGVHRLILTEQRTASATYGGVALAGQFDLGGGEFLELTAGTGLVRMRGVEDWWVPIFGMRGSP
ncbi:hypothetical protein HPC49_08275 [Pyxidicoccus fallax]|uniref:Lipoprotein n=1 Tax=Pyxidicoccus fallax TaxID=394095 RepID=A0A848L9Y1_9BACT|nr:hypothetical protein [Pyxidicoccus fallax]NMO15062.1 hypothetical protein [Pyxidicoccus fallax]NPC78250.1 hypothetical protein [Pyxidicoccus fallax]